MSFTRKTWTLVRKNLLLVWSRHWLSCLVTAFLTPVIYAFFIAFSKNFFIPPAGYGIGSQVASRTLADALSYAGSTRSTLAFVTNNLGTEVQQIIDDISPTIRNAGVNPVVLSSNTDLLTTCASTVRGTTPCFAAVRFESTPSRNGTWAYTIRADGAFENRIFVTQSTNYAQIYVLPLQRAIDNAIAARNGSSIPQSNNYPFTSSTTEERNKRITELYMNALIRVIGIAYVIGLVGILYQLTGLMATERELGISQLIEVMTARKRDWEAQAMRLLSYHLAYDILYFPGWILVGLIIARLNFPASSTGIMVGWIIIAGLSFSSWSIFCAGFFRKAQLSGITVTIVSVVLAIIAQVQTPRSSGAIVITGLLFPPMNFLYMIFFMAYFQQQDLPARLGQSAPNAPWRVPGYTFFILAIIQIFVYPFLGAFVERWLYGTTSKARIVERTGGDARETVKITGLSKIYRPSWSSKIWARITRQQIPETVVAVNELDLAILKGELSVILGANGAGKSTTMDMLAGLQAPSSGTIEIDGSSIGICPQKNVLWDELTCQEHVDIFNSLKSAKADAKSINSDLLIACDLKQKLNARSETLSGGQKRKLQLAMMLTGGSNVCLLDEVSSGLDPLSRRKIWDILLRERGNRSLLFSTHFLDEADYLSDTITVLSKGTLVARGSSVELKQMHGGGYRVKIYNNASFKQPAHWSSLKKHTYTDHIVYNVSDSTAAAELARDLENMGIHQYRVDGPTVEDVFLKLATEARATTELRDTASSKSPGSDDEDQSLKLHPGHRLSILAQTLVLFRKRITILKRNYFPYLAAIVIPIACAGLITLFLQGFTRLSCSPGANVQPSRTVSLLTAPDIFGSLPNIPVGPPGAVPSDILQRLVPSLAGGSANGFLRFVNSADSLNNYVTANYSRTFPGGFFLTPGAEPLFAWRGNGSPALAMLVQNLMNNALYPNTPILTNYQSFDVPFTPDTGDSLQAVLYFGLAMCIYPAFFALYPTAERLNKVRALHWSNGVRVLPLWLAYLLFDFIFVLIVSVVTSIIYATISSDLYFSNYFFLVFMLYGLASMLLSYIVCLYSKSQLSAFAIASGYLLATFGLYFLAYMLIITFAPAASINRLVNVVHFVLAAVTPSGNLLRVLLISYNQFSLLCQGQEAKTNAGDMTVLGGPIIYLILQSLILFGMLIWIESGWRPGFLSRKSKKTKSVEEAESRGEADVDAEVYHEKTRVETAKDELRVSHISKRFGDNLAVNDVSFGVPRDEVFALLGPNGAGKSTTFGMIRGDIRPTGRDADVLIEDISIIRNRASARVYQGVCPQFDAMDAMTVVEHLEFYARARGVKDISHNVSAVIEAVGLSAYKRRLASKLSGGNKRKLSLGIALVGDPTVLLIDEGSSGMDAAAKRVMWRTLQDISTGRSMVISTHAMEEADALADRVGIMASKMLALGTADELRKKYGDELNVHVVHKDAPYTSPEDMERLKSWIKHTFDGANVEERTFHGQVRFTVPNQQRSTAIPARSTEDSSTDGETGGSIGGLGDLKNASSDQPTERISGIAKADNGISSLFARLEAAKTDLGVAFFAVNQPTLDSVFLSIVQRHNVLEENYRAEHAQKIGLGGRVWRSLKKVYHNA